MSTRFRVLGGAVLLMLASCGASASTTSGTVGSSASCQEPPAAELTQVSPLALTVEPNPAVSGSEAMLSLDGLSDDYIAGAGASWECWNGTEWMATHQIIKDYGRYGGANTLEVEQGATTTIEAIGLSVPYSYPILIPNVSPGMYRIEDRVFRPGGVDIAGFVLIEVVGAGAG